MTETTIRERLTSFLENEKVSKAEFGKRIGVSNAFVTSLKKSISPDKLQRIKEEFPTLNIDWLQFGTGTMYNELSAAETSGIRGGYNPTANEMLLAALRESQAQTTKSQEQIWADYATGVTWCQMISGGVTRTPP